MQTIKRSENRFRKLETRFQLFLLSTLLLLFVSNGISATNPEIKKGTITGNIAENVSNSPLQYAQVAIYNQSDSSLVSGTITKENGNFRIENLPFGKYYLVAEYIGYKREIKNDIIVDNERNTIELNNIILAEKITEIGEVNVVGRKEGAVVKADKKVLNVDKNLSAIGGTAIDALKVSPSITVNQEGNVLLRGSTSFKVLIDGRPSALKPNDALKQIPAGRIDKIEIITNPSVKYESEGTAGLINIITKKGMGAGTSGQINASAGTGDKYNTDINVNFTNDKLNVTVGAKWKDSQNFYNMDEIIETSKDGNKRRNDIQFYRHQTDKDFGGNITLDYNFNDKKNLVYAAEIGYTDLFINANFKYDETTDNQPAHTYVYEDIATGLKANYFTNNLSYTSKPTENKTWTHSLFYSRINYFFDDKQNRYYTDSDFDYLNGNPYYKMRFENDNSSNEFRAKTDFTETHDNGAVFDAGAQYHIYQRYLDLEAENYNFDDNNWQPDPEFTNEFDFNEQIYSIYGNYNSEFKGFNYQIGIRLEYTNRLIESFTINEKYKYEKLNYFSTLSVSKTFGEDMELAFNYSNRIDRPDEYYLNPFPDVSNEFQKAYGNPLLRPHITNSYELSFQKHFEKGMFSSQAFYRSTDDAYTQVIGSDSEGIMILTFDNISDDKEYGVENMLNFQAFNWWSLNASLNFMGQNSKGIMNDENFDRSAFTFDTRLINSFVIGENTSAQLMAFYFHDRLGNAIGNVKRFYWFDASIQHNFLSDRLSLTLQAKDIFNTNQLKFDIDRSDYRFYVHRKPEYPTVLLSLSYKFNNFKNNNKRVKTNLKI